IHGGAQRRPARAHRGRERVQEIAEPDALPPRHGTPALDAHEARHLLVARESLQQIGDRQALRATGVEPRDLERSRGEVLRAASRVLGSVTGTSAGSACHGRAGPSAAGGFSCALGEAGGASGARGGANGAWAALGAAGGASCPPGAAGGASGALGRAGGASRALAVLVSLPPASASEFVTSGFAGSGAGGEAESRAGV